VVWFPKLFLSLIFKEEVIKLFSKIRNFFSTNQFEDKERNSRVIIFRKIHAKQFYFTYRFKKNVLYSKKENIE